MRKKLAAVSATAFVMSALAAGPAMAHNAGPCGNEGPGNSGYAQHHIVALALEQGLGEDGHKPGTHRGFSVCLGVHD